MFLRLSYRIKAKLRTERNLIDEQSTWQNLSDRKLISPFGSIYHSIIATAHLISIRHSEDQLPLKAEHFVSYFRDVMM
jgi:hypothetical protein